MTFRNQPRPSEERLRDLPLVAAPDSVWTSIEAALDAGQGPRTNRAFGMRRWLATAACLLVAAGLYWNASRRTHPQWEVLRLQGSPSIAARRIGTTGRIGEGQWLETDGGSRAEIHVGGIGTVQVDANTRVRVVAARPTEQRLALAHGRITASVVAPPRLFFVDTSSSTAVDLGCAYTMDVDDAGSGVLHVTAGWVSLEFGGRQSLVPAGASCRTRPGTGPGTPFFDDAAQAFIRALEEIDFGKGGAGGLDMVLPAARVRDTLTLWHLLSRVSAPDRLRVYNRMAELAPPPPNILPGKVLGLDPETLKQWKEDLAWKW